MSETMPFPPVTTDSEAPAKRTPTVYFIDDSATMREVIKIAFRRRRRIRNFAVRTDSARRRHHRRHHARSGRLFRLQPDQAASAIQRDSRHLDVRCGEQECRRQSCLRRR